MRVPTVAEGIGEKPVEIFGGVFDSNDQMKSYMSQNSNVECLISALLLVTAVYTNRRNSSNYNNTTQV